jgi:hypothetical protein
MINGCFPRVNPTFHTGDIYCQIVSAPRFFSFTALYTGTCTSLFLSEFFNMYRFRYCTVYRHFPLFNILPMVVDRHHIDADPDPTFHFEADLDPTFHVDADPDPEPTSHFDADPDPTFLFDPDPTPSFTLV